MSLTLGSRPNGDAVYRNVGERILDECDTLIFHLT